MHSLPTFLTLVSSFALSLPPFHPPYLLLHHCCLMPACMKAANWSHRWTEKLRFRAESQTNKMLMNDYVTATLNRHFYDSLYLCLSLLKTYFLFMIILLLCCYAVSQFEKTGSFFFNHVFFCCMSSGDNSGPCSLTFGHAMGLLFLK